MYLSGLTSSDNLDRLDLGLSVFEFIGQVNTLEHQPHQFNLDQCLEN